MEIIFIAEIGMNHNGNFGLLHELIKQAAQSKANIAKFQLGWRDGPEEINNINDETIELILKLCEYYSIEPMFSIIKDRAYEQIKKFNLKRYKIASRTVVENPELVQKILSEGKETFLSLGRWESKKKPFTEFNNVKYLWCKSLYPTAVWDLKGFPLKFDNNTYEGISDHCIGLEVALLAIARGATIVEKHFTLDKSDTTIRDHALSLLPSEFKNLVDLGNGISKVTRTIESLE